jgi:hypothetical protein
MPRLGRAIFDRAVCKQSAVVTRFVIGVVRPNLQRNGPPLISWWRTRPHGQRQNRTYVATFRFVKVQPSSPSACLAAATRSVRHSV